MTYYLDLRLQPSQGQGQPTYRQTLPSTLFPCFAVDNDDITIFASRYNDVAVAFSLIGNFEDYPVPQNMLDAAEAMIGCGVSQVSFSPSPSPPPTLPPSPPPPPQIMQNRTFTQIITILTPSECPLTPPSHA